MSATRKTRTPSKKSISDIDAPGKTVPPKTSKSVIVTNRPILQDPMVVDEPKADNPPAAKKTTIAHTAETIKPAKSKEELKQDNSSETPVEAPAAPDESEPPEKPPSTDSKAEAEETSEKPPNSSKSPKEAVQETPPKKDDQAQAKQNAVIERLVNSKKYELPINAVEKRKTKQFVVLGIFLAILLVVVWVDVALDAGLIKLNGIKPITHFFSN